MRTTNHACLLSLLVIIASGCSNDDESVPIEVTEQTDAGTKGPVEEEGGPRFLSLGTNVAEITQGEAVTITAVVTDPDGIDDLIGGALKSPDGSVSYGAFATSGQEGAYSITLGWGQMHQSEAIEFIGEAQREFSAEFFDAGGKKASQIVTVRLHCDDDGEAACEGICRDVSDDNGNCGACGFVCPGESSCTDGGCIAWTQSKNRGTCDVICQRDGATCAPKCTRDGSDNVAFVTYYGDGDSAYCAQASESCQDTPPELGPCPAGYPNDFITQECCCEWAP